MYANLLSLSTLLSLSLALNLVNAKPVRLQARAVTTSGTPITSQAQLNSRYAVAAQAGGQAFLDLLQQIVPLGSPTSIAQAQTEISTILTANGNDTLKSAADLLLNGLAGGDYTNIINSFATESSTTNTNTREPNTVIYPKASAADAPYSVSESTLRQSIYIPPAFTYGQKPIALLLPGTASVGGQTFGSTIGKLLAANNVADTVYINVPYKNLNDIQVNSEYIAYAVNYISGISNNANVTTISWSAGSLDGQWALKYWPSTRSKVSNKIGISPDYHGTVYAELLCTGLTTSACPPAINQQQYTSNFIGTLRNNGGDSAYVPTTNIYSIFDEIVQPQSDPNASGFLNDARNVGVSNVELQKSCTAALPGGAINNDHEGVLYNALAYSLIVDAIKNKGPGQLSRVNVASQCAKFAADGLSLADIFATEALIVNALIDTGSYSGPQYTGEPPIMSYAAADTP